MNNEACRELQIANELRYAEKHISAAILEEILQNTEITQRIELGITLMRAWIAKWTGEYEEQCSSEKYFESKKSRVLQIAKLNLQELITDIFVNTTLLAPRPELFVSVTAQLAHKLGFDEKREAIQTVAEVIGVLADTDLYDLTKVSDRSSVRLQSKIAVSEELQDAIDRAQYLPPMVCEPEEITTNYKSPYLTFNESQILGKRNAHSEDICLDVINLQNKVPLRLDTYFLSKCKETPTKPISNEEQLVAWEQFKQESKDVYHLMISQGNRFWIPNRPDKRGRLYACGYHITPQGTAYKKAMIELANEEVITGVPT